ncbi:hypothetical protein [Streptomyces sp. NPDC048639]|uniref:hypothetical protein n=1 Tax=Streptomyces sp. NPDC048639 TaxID=3365581 RepID=UPI003723E345
MRMHKIATATMLVLAVSGWTGGGSGIAFADTGPAGGKASAQGGSSTAGDVFQQSIAQSARQNNNCNNPNTGENGDLVTLTGGRAAGRCVNTDGSLTAFSRIQNGPAEAQGGTSGTSLAQQNAAQRGRQNNNCNSPNELDISLDPGRLEDHCTQQDSSFSKHTRTKSDGARAQGGSSPDGDLHQQNVAQVGRQNNNCNNPNAFANLEVTGGRVEDRCTEQDSSFSEHTRTESGGALAEGGSSSTSSTVAQQNIAQEGRQNNNCNNSNAFSFLEVTGSRVGAHCGSKDRSSSKHTHIKGGGAQAQGGSSTGGSVDQQNVAQEGRQNNNCSSANENGEILLTGGRLEGRCTQQDSSFSKHTRIKGGGAEAQGGSSTADNVTQQNIAQEGRQNNNCDNPNDSADLTVTGGRVEDRCTQQDSSFSKHTDIKGGGAQAQGGSSSGGSVGQQNVAQEGRQNNNCSNPNQTNITVSGGRLTGRCGTKDGSFNKHTLVRGGGAQAQGGSSTGASVHQQNTAQEGRQNNNCSNPNAGGLTLTGSRSQVGCKTVDGSANLHTAEIGGGAQAEGGSATADLFQQNTAQEGRQNNSCGSTNNLNLTATGSTNASQCTAVDRSTNIGSINR